MVAKGGIAQGKHERGNYYRVIGLNDDANTTKPLNGYAWWIAQGKHERVSYYRVIGLNNDATTNKPLTGYAWRRREG